MREQYEERPKLLKLICEEFCTLSRSYGIEPTVTRVTDSVPGESGVHPAGRAVDFRDEYWSGGRWKRLYPDEIVMAICQAMNVKFSRTDGKPTILNHAFKGGPRHFHCQVSLNQMNEFALKQRAPKEGADNGTHDSSV
jgi:hypothetical protein